MEDKKENRPYFYSKEVRYIKESDRFIKIERNEEGIYSINYMQGDDKEAYMACNYEHNEDLTIFVKTIINGHPGLGWSFADVDQVLWMYNELCSHNILDH